VSPYRVKETPEEPAAQPVSAAVVGS